MACRVLLVEDNPASLELMRYLLDSGGYQTLLATNGQEALEHLSRVLPDLVLTDIQMPVLDGYELLSHIRNSPRTRGLLVVALTAYSMPGDHERVMGAGFDGYMSKPIDPETILDELRHFLSRGAASGRLGDLD